MDVVGYKNVTFESRMSVACGMCPTCISIYCLCVCVCSDLTGSMDGSVRMWEFGTQRVVSQQRSPGTPSITEIRFTPQGNKYGVTDTSGKLYLWQGIHTSTKMPYKVRHAHRLLVISNRLLIM